MEALNAFGESLLARSSARQLDFVEQDGFCFS